MTESLLRAVLAEYLDLLQRHSAAEEMMAAIVTEDFETGFEGKPRRSFHHSRLRRERDRWHVAAQIVERFADLNDNAARLFATP